MSGEEDTLTAILHFLNPWISTFRESPGNAIKEDPTLCFSTLGVAGLDLCLWRLERSDERSLKRKIQMGYGLGGVIPSLVVIINFLNDSICCC